MICVILRRIEISEPIDHPRPTQNIHIPIEDSHLLDAQLRQIQRVFINRSHQNRRGVFQLENLYERVLLLDAWLMVPWTEPQHVLLGSCRQHSHVVPRHVE